MWDSCRNSSHYFYSHSTHSQKLHQCHFCDKSNFRKQSDLKKHLMSDHPFQCNFCLKKYVKNAHLENHILSVHEGKKFICDLCVINFVSKSSLESHNESFHDFRNPKLCKLCNKEFGKLRRHITSVHKVW